MTSTEAVKSVLGVIHAKRNGQTVGNDDLATVVLDYTAGRIADYQMAALLATVACTGLTHAETVALTRAYVSSGSTLNLSTQGKRVVDKHSTGGVGDKVSLFVVPVVAACGVPVAKLSGQGLDFMGGTIDKLSSISGLRMDLGTDEVVDVLTRTGMVVSGQSDDLVPGDRATYALRDVTGTVDSLPLIAASIMSKKIAIGTQGVVLDVKYGPGAVIGSVEEARELAVLMLRIGHEVGLPARAVLSDMRQPLGYAVGNSLEVAEALRALRGEWIPRYSELCETIARLMLQLGRPELDVAAATVQVKEAIASGRALAKFREWAEEQGGDVSQIDDPSTLPSAPHAATVRATHDGWVAGIDARTIGSAAARLGAGRFSYEQQIDHGAGLVLGRQVGERVQAGDVLAELYGSAENLESIVVTVASAFHVEDHEPDLEPVVSAILGGGWPDGDAEQGDESENDGSGNPSPWW
ncbi:thymidine phosphorylase [Streptomyces cyaneofuscatus]|uniref:thymidine phosphorylase n=1 Tax=Streptomyces cyaneofuscatus TaxID=66883 RepID=UPI0033B3F06D